MPSTFDHVRRMTAEAVAAARRGVGNAYSEASRPGPDIKVSPFEPGAVTGGAALVKLANSIFASARERANYREKKAEQEVEREYNRLRRDKLAQDIAKSRAEMNEAPEPTYPITVAPDGSIVPQTIEGPVAEGQTHVVPGAVTGRLGFKDYNQAMAADVRRKQADERLDDAQYRLGQADQRIALAHEAGNRAERRFAVYKSEVARRQQSAEFDFKLPNSDKSAIQQAEAAYDEAVNRAYSTNYGDPYSDAAVSQADQNRLLTRKRAYMRYLQDNPTPRAADEIMAAIPTGHPLENDQELGATVARLKQPARR